MSDVLVIHLDDRSTDFLKLIYKDKNYDIINDGNMRNSELVDQIRNHNKIIMMGHGLPYGLINVNRGPKNLNLFFINDSHADLLREKETVSIWCFSDEYFSRNTIKGFHTGMIISETSEERMVLNYEPLNKDELLDNMNFMATIFSECIELSPEEIRSYMLTNYNRHDPVSEFNRKNMIVI